MLNKVIKKMKKENKLKKNLPKNSKGKYPNANNKDNTGFHAKASSQLGEERRRSMGNRLNKPAR